MLLLLASACGYTEVRTECPTCVVVDRVTAPATICDGTRTVYLLVPGMLGFGWEWDEPLALLRAAPRTAVQVFSWRPSSSLGADARDLARRANQLLAGLPPSTKEVYLVGHSAGGLITAQAAALLAVPPTVQLHIVNVGAPYGGMHATPFDSEDQLEAPFPLALGGTFTRYPRPALRVTVESWITTWPGDPVMKRRFGHDPGDPRVGPPGARHLLPPNTDHNRVLAFVVRALLSRAATRPR